VWDPQSGKALHKLQQPAVATSVAISPDMTLLAAIGGTKDQPCEIRLWELESGRPSRTLSWGRGAAHCVAFSPDGDLLVAANANGHVQSWDTKTWTEQNTFRAHANTIWRLAFAPGGKVFATAGHDGRVRMWDAAKLEAKK